MDKYSKGLKIQDSSFKVHYSIKQNNQNSEEKEVRKTIQDQPINTLEMNKREQSADRGEHTSKSSTSLTIKNHDTNSKTISTKLYAEPFELKPKNDYQIGYTCILCEEEHDAADQNNLTPENQRNIIRNFVAGVASVQISNPHITTQAQFLNDPEHKAMQSTQMPVTDNSASSKQKCGRGCMPTEPKEDDTSQSVKKNQAGLRKLRGTIPLAHLRQQISIYTEVQGSQALEQHLLTYLY
ncbi:hypothetical protein DFH28DRAFT_926623 [Melampsora americana]|nr:hypothetical protein DFH28DRAFT_926623 [Melampsora americana]